MNMKKVGLTALAASLVSFSANAGELTVSGAASLNMSGYSAGANGNNPKTFSMGDQFTFSGGGELDNGLNVSVSFTIDDEDAIRNILKSSIPESVIEYLISNDSLRRLATIGGGGEPVG